MTVDPKVEFYGRRCVDFQTTPLQAVQRAYNEATSRCQVEGREPLQVEVVIKVAPITDKGTPASVQP